VNDSGLAPAPEWVIEPRREGVPARLRDVWRYRKLLRFFASKSLDKLYRRTVLGWSWLFIRPLFPLFVTAAVFGGMLGVESAGVPYFLFLVVGTSAWELFASGAMWGTRSLELNRGLISKIYVPRLILPIAMMTPAFLSFAIHLGVIALTAAYYQVTVGSSYLQLAHAGWAVAGATLSVTLALGLSFWTSVPALVARDVRFTLGYVLGFWVFLTPVLYSAESIAPRYRGLLLFNPMAAAVEMFKYGILGVGVVNRQHVVAAVATTVVILGSGFWFFGRAEADAADKV
jgi:lipopolysaccharide transport system permease protein